MCQRVFFHEVVGLRLRATVSVKCRILATCLVKKAGTSTEDAHLLKLFRYVVFLIESNICLTQLKQTFL